jgi:hypothetical protein
MEGSGAVWNLGKKRLQASADKTSADNPKKTWDWLKE